MSSHWQRRRFIIAAVLISITLLITLRFALEQALFPLPVEVNPGIYDTFPLDEMQRGWSQVALIVISGVIVWIPFRRREPWAWFTLWLFLFLFACPVVLYPLAISGFLSVLWQGIVTFLPMIAGLLVVVSDIIQLLRK